MSVQGNAYGSYRQGQANFNTSYVSVQALAIYILPFFLGISIHLMCRFKQEQARGAKTHYEFQYILCVGSSDGEPISLHIGAIFQYILCVGSSSKFFT